MNYMKEVAQMLGVELYEEFNINTSGKTKFRFTENGLEYYYGTWLKCSEVNELLAGKCEIIKIPKPILDNAEKEYLRNIINPWRNCVECISKYGLSNCEYIAIVYYDKLTEKEYRMFFPSFAKGEMYKGMETNKHYTLEELGL